MKRLVSPTLLILLISSFAVGWRANPDDRIYYPHSMTLDGSRLYVSDTSAGLHVYDVSNLSAPTKVLRIPLKYNVSSAVKDDIVFTNHGSQLQAIRITGDSYEVVAKIGEAPPDRPRVIDNPTMDEGYGCMACGGSFDPDKRGITAPSAGSSFATFAVIDNQLYRVDGSYGQLLVYDVMDATKPELVSRVNSSWSIETLFPTPNYLFVGGRVGMYIFDRSDPWHPQQISKIEHTVACDPVVVEGSTAFVTLRSFGECGSPGNELLCIDIADPSHPSLIGEKPLTTPFGLAVQDSQLFVSHGDSGYSLIDVSHPDAPAITKTWTGTTRDFIWSGTTLFVLEDHNVAIYDVTDPTAPVLISRVEPAVSL